MNNQIIAFVVMLVAGLAIDFLWIGVISKGFYKNNLGPIALKKSNGDLAFRMLPALIFYIIFVLSILILVVIPANGVFDLNNILKGSLLGLACYATYDLTNYATLKDFKLKVVLVDMTWGVLLTTVITTIGLLFLML